MDDLDLSDIDPLKWAEVRRRVDAVKRYLALEKPTTADRERLGALLGLGAQQFSNLVKAWLAHRAAIALAPGWRGVRPSRSKRDGVDACAREIARNAILEIGPTAPLPDLLEATTLRCGEAGVTPPSRGTIWLLAMEARGSISDGAPSGILVARAHLRLPVDIGSNIVFPEVVIAVETPTGRIVDILLVGHSGEFDARRAAAFIRGNPDLDSLPITATENEGPALRRHLPDTEITLVSRTEAGKLLSSLVGKRIGRVEIAFRPPSVRPSTVMQSGRDRAPNLEDAELALEMARERYNEELETAD